MSNITNLIVCKSTKKFQLDKQSSEQELKNYFNAVLEIAKSDNEFPINLDDVWMLVYGQKSDAVEALKSNFIEGVDFQVLRENPQNSKGGRPTNIYKLSLSCMEFFIARKVRAVFEVYRQVFHGVMNGTIAPKKQTKPRKPSVTPTRVKAGIAWVEGVSQLLNLNDSSKLLLLGKVAQPLELPLPDYTPSKGVLRSASELLKANGLNISSRHFNGLMQDNGYIEELSRKSTEGKDKRFKSISKKGLVYGENQVSPHNPHETQPLYYVDKFPELLKELNLL